MAFFLLSPDPNFRCGRIGGRERNPMGGPGSLRSSESSNCSGVGGRWVRGLPHRPGPWLRTRCPPPALYLGVGLGMKGSMLGSWTTLGGHLHKPSAPLQTPGDSGHRGDNLMCMLLLQLWPWISCLEDIGVGEKVAVERMGWTWARMDAQLGQRASMEKTSCPLP